MELAWVISKDEEVEAALHHPDLQVRPAGEQVPALMQGTLLGDIYARLVRLNEGERHARLRDLALGIIDGWNTDRISDLARTVAGTMPLGDVAAYVVASLVGLQHPSTALSYIHDFAGAIAGGASDEAIARGIEATPYLFELLPDAGDFDERANRLGLLFQAYAGMRQPVVMTRRWAARDLELFGKHVQRGDAVTVLLTSPKFTFGAGRHACPGQGVVLAIRAAFDEVTR